MGQSRELTVKRRPKFGVFFILMSLVFGLGLLMWLVWPRHKEVIGVDRWHECRACKARL